jgi:hypothetical protein
VDNDLQHKDGRNVGEGMNMGCGSYGLWRSGKEVELLVVVTCSRMSSDLCIIVVHNICTTVDIWDETYMVRPTL